MASMLVLTLVVAALAIAPCLLPEERAALLAGKAHVDVIRVPR